MFAFFVCFDGICKTYRLPVDALEERMVDDVHEGRIPVTAETIRRVLVEETFEHRGGLNTEGPRNTDRLFQDHLEQVVLGVLCG